MSVQVDSVCSHGEMRFRLESFEKQEIFWIHSAGTICALSFEIKQVTGRVTASIRVLNGLKTAQGINFLMAQCEVYLQGDDKPDLSPEIYSNLFISDRPIQLWSLDLYGLREKRVFDAKFTYMWNKSAFVLPLIEPLHFPPNDEIRCGEGIDKAQELEIQEEIDFSMARIYIRKAFVLEIPGEKPYNFAVIFRRDRKDYSYGALELRAASPNEKRELRLAELSADITIGESTSTQGRFVPDSKYKGGPFSLIVPIRIPLYGHKLFRSLLKLEFPAEATITELDSWRAGAEWQLVHREGGSGDTASEFTQGGDLPKP